MQVVEIVRRVRQVAGDTNAIQFTNETLLDWINQGIRECVLSNMLCEKTATQNTITNQESYDLPTDILKLHSVALDSGKLDVMTLQEFEQRRDGYKAATDTGKPVESYIWAGKLVLVPKPDGVYPLRVNYIYTPVLVAADGDVPAIPEPYHMRIVMYCLAQVALMDDDFNKYQSLMMQFNSGVINMQSLAGQEDDQYPMISVSSRDAGEDYGW